jgi:hypothetical protein
VQTDLGLAEIQSTTLQLAIPEYIFPNPVALYFKGNNLRQRQWRFDCGHEDRRMKPPQKRFTKGAAIYKSEKFVGIEGLSGSNALKYREDDGHMIYLEPDATNEVLGRSLLTALEKSRYVDVRSEREFYNWERGSAFTRNGSKSIWHAMVINRSVLHS